MKEKLKVKTTKFIDSIIRQKTIYKPMHIIALLVLLFCSSCSTEEENIVILEGLTQRQLIPVILTLKNHNIESNRIAAGTRERLYSVGVSKNNYYIALDLLNSKGLPRPDFYKEIENLSKQNSIFSSNSEITAFRIDYLLALDLERIISNFESVVGSRVVVRSNLNSFLANRGNEDEKQKKVSATVYIDYISENDVLPFSSNEIYDLVATSIPEIQKQNINLHFHNIYDKNSFIGENLEDVEVSSVKFKFLGLVLPKDQAFRFAILFSFVGLLLIVSSFILGYNLRLKSKAKNGDFR